MNERDTHFQGFANLLFEEICKIPGLSIEDIYPDVVDNAVIPLIAQRAYDLAYHVIYETSYGMDKFYISERINENVPDLTEWPKP